MEKQNIPYQRAVFVCTNRREGGKIACANPGRGGDELCEQLKAYVKEAGLKSKIRVAKSGCLDLCARGPNVFIYPEGAWYGGVTPTDIPELIKKITAGIS